MTETLDPAHRKSDRPLRRLSSRHQPARAATARLNLRAPSATTLNPFAGAHAVGWDLRDDDGAAVGIGIYFARLEVERRTLIQKLAAVK